MKTHTNDFKTNIKNLGRELAIKVTYGNSTLGNEQINSANLNYKGDILKSVMKQLELDSNIDIPLETQINVQIGLLVNGAYEYLDYGDFIVNKSEKQENTNSYILTCYDNMLLSMIPYEDLGVTYPITIRDYIDAICDKLGLTFANSSDTFTNYDKEIQNELYLDSDGNSLDYTFRDVLDELAQVTASTICINKDDELEVRYINETEEKNLFSFTKSPFDHINNNVSSYTITSPNSIELTIINNETYDSIWFNIDLPNGDIVLSAVANCDIDTNDKVGIGIETYPIGSTTRTTWNEIWFTKENRNNHTRKNITLTIDNTQYYYKLRVFGNQTIVSARTTSFSDIMIEEGTQPTEYVPYGDTIDEEYLKNVNVKFGEVYGPINTITLSRSADSDNISLSIPEDLDDDLKKEIKISDNQILNGNNRDAFLSGILEKLYGLSYYTNDYSSTGILYYDLCDKYNVKVGEETYSCVMFNDEINLSNGLVENIHTDMPKDSKTDYTKTDKTDRKVNQTYLIVDKQNGTITSAVNRINEIDVRENNNYQKVMDTFGNYALQNDLVTLETSVETLQSDTYTKTEINTKLTDGSVTKVMTTSGTFDADGMHYEKTDAPTKTTINEKGVEVDSSSNNNELLFAGYDDNIKQTIVRTDNINVKRYLVIGNNSRLEDYGNGGGMFIL